MMAWSLGEMEGTVGVSLLAGRLVLDKSELVQGSELPINYLFAITSYASQQQCIPSAGMIIVAILAAVSTLMTLILCFTLWWSEWRELVGMQMNLTNGTVRNVIEIPLFSPNFSYFLNLCFVILFHSPSFSFVMT